jgi:hypothetical protein
MLNPKLRTLHLKQLYFLCFVISLTISFIANAFVNGDILVPNPLEGTVKISIIQPYNKLAEQGIMSAVRIGPRHYLTAGHNSWLPKLEFNEGQGPIRLIAPVYLKELADVGLNRFGVFSLKTEIIQIHTHPEFPKSLIPAKPEMNWESKVNDLAIFEVKDEISIDIVPIVNLYEGPALSIGSQVHLGGYGPGTALGENEMILPVKKKKLHALTSELLVFSPLDEDGKESFMVNGDSGAPVIVSKNGKNFIAGINISIAKKFADLDFQKHKITIAARIDAESRSEKGLSTLEWIHSILPKTN